MNLPTFFYRFLLVCALLLTQLGGLTHSISHTLAEHTQDQSQPHDKLCDLCAVYEQIGSALGSSLISFTAVEQEISFVAASFAVTRPSSFAAFAARAPPVSQIIA